MSIHLPPACVETDGFLVELAYGEESAVPATAKQHLAACDRCQAELRALQGVRDAAGSLPLEEPSAQLDANIFAALDDHLAGKPVDAHLKLAESPPPARPKMTVLQGGATDRAPAPATRKDAPKRRRSWAPWAAAASVAVVASGTWLVSREESVLERDRIARAKSDVAHLSKAIGRLQDEAKDLPAKEEAANVLHEERAKVESDALAGAAPPPMPKAAMPAPSKPRPAFGAGGDAPGAMQKAREAPSGFAASARGGGAPPPPAEAKSELLELPSSPPPPPPPTAPPAPVLAAEPRAMAPAPSADAESVAPQRSVASTAPRAVSDSDSARAAPAVEAESTSESVSIRRLERSSKKKADASSLDDQAVWSHRLSEGRAALDRGDWKWADEQFASVLQTKSLPSYARREALEGRVTALDALGRAEEADALAVTLARDFPSSTVSQQRARAVPTAK